MKWQAKYSTEIKQPESWQQLPFGQDYCNVLNHYFANWFDKILGQQILKIGNLSGEINDPCLYHQQIILSHKITENLTALLAHNENLSIVEGNTIELPFLSQSINGCLLANNLNFCQDPHQLLRECDRVLTEDGYLLIAIFNPCSRLFFHRQLKGGQESFFFRKFLTRRIIDWLALLSFDILDQQNLPIKKEHRCFASITVIVAQKKSHPLTLNPQKAWFQSPEFLPSAVRGLITSYF